MATPKSPSRLPVAGDVLPYGYLWSHESSNGRDDPAKERPCVVVLSVGPGPHPQVMVAPITSRDPGREQAIALASGVAGMARPSWIIPWEVNVFQWVGPDVGRAPQPAGAWWRIGALSPALRRVLRERIEAELRARRVRIERRTE